MELNINQYNELEAKIREIIIDGWIAGETFTETINAIMQAIKEI